MTVMNWMTSLATMMGVRNSCSYSTFFASCNNTDSKSMKKRR